MDLTDIYRIIHPNTEEYTFYSSHKSFSKIGHIFQHQINIDKFRKFQITFWILSDYIAIKLRITSEHISNKYINL